MAFKDKLPVSYLLFTNRGRIDRLTYWTLSLFIWTSFYILFNLLTLISYSATWTVYPLLFWTLIATATKRLHDTNKSGHWIWLVLLPVLGPVYLLFQLGFKKGKKESNSFGEFPGSTPDYYKNTTGLVIEHIQTEERVINDITQLNPIFVREVRTPTTITELQNIIRESEKISIGGGRFSMGGQTASSRTTHIDMRQLNKIIAFSAEEKTIKVEAGARWCDIQKYVDPYNLSVKIMQTYANFTVGGSLSVNCHGRYIGQGAVILSVKSIEVILANGEIKKCTPNENSELFFACIGCYNAIAVLATVEFDLVDNVPVKRVFKKLKIEEYHCFFFKKVRDNKNVVFHNGDIYPPHYRKIRAVSWVVTDENPTVKNRLMPLAGAYPLERYFINAFSKSNFGKWRRENIIDPIVYRSKKVHWRNYEAGYDVLELEPNSRKNSTYVLQEYFVPVANFDAFGDKMAEIFQRHKVNVINVSIRHAEQDSGSLLAWSKEEVFAFVVWYKQNTNEVEKGKVAVWTRELISASISLNGSYYLPYQVHATNEQFHKAYPNATKLFELKTILDPNFKFTNVLWDKYYKQS